MGAEDRRNMQEVEHTCFARALRGVTVFTHFGFVSVQCTAAGGRMKDLRDSHAAVSCPVNSGQC